MTPTGIAVREATTPTQIVKEQQRHGCLTSRYGLDRPYGGVDPQGGFKSSTIGGREPRG